MEHTRNIVVINIIVRSISKYCWFIYINTACEQNRIYRLSEKSLFRRPFYEYGHVGWYIAERRNVIPEQ